MKLIQIVPKDILSDIDLSRKFTQTILKKQDNDSINTVKSWKLSKDEHTNAGKDNDNNCPNDHELGKINCHVDNDFEEWSILGRQPEFEQYLDPCAYAKNCKYVFKSVYFINLVVNDV